MNSKLNFIIITLFLSYSFHLVHTCYFTNCPWGGKRIISEDHLKYCKLCANGMGMCFGPHICCGPELGCVLNTKNSIPCQFEDKSVEPCKTYGKKCSLLNYGRCATQNLCCNADTCTFDLNCNDDKKLKFEKSIDRRKARLNSMKLFH